MVSPVTETSIWMALNARVASLVLSPVLPVFYTTKAETTAPLTGYLLVTHIRNRTLRPLIGTTAPNHFRGILQIDVMSKLNMDEAVAAQIAGTVADHFPADLLLTFDVVTVRITKRPDIGQTMTQATNLKTPVSVEYETFA